MRRQYPHDKHLNLSSDATNHNSILSPEQKIKRLNRIRKSAEKMRNKKYREYYYSEDNCNRERAVIELIELGIPLPDAINLISRTYASGCIDEL
jgi:hypothetical protein